MLIKKEDLSPKRIVNFYLPHNITAEGRSLLFTAADKNSPVFIKEIFDSGTVKRCFAAGNFISTAFADNADKETAEAVVMAAADDYLQTDILADTGASDNLYAVCEALADALIRPFLNRDKGDVSLFLRNSTLEVKFTGHCAGCPYAENTLHNVIINTFRRYLPQIEEVKLKE